MEFTLHNIIKGRSDLGLAIRHSISVQVGDGQPRGKLNLGTGVLSADETLHQVKDRPAVQSRLSINAFGHVGVFRFACSSLRASSESVDDRSPSM